MPTERNNRQLSEISDKKVEEVAKKYNDQIQGLFNGDLSHGKTTGEILLAFGSELERETRRETLMEAARIAEKCMTGEQAAAELEREAKEIK